MERCSGIWPRSSTGCRILSDVFKSRCYTVIGFGRLLSDILRLFPLFSIENRISDLPGFGRMSNVGNVLIRSMISVVSDVISDYPLLGNHRNSPCEITPDYMIKPYPLLVSEPAGFYQNRRIPPIRFYYSWLCRFDRNLHTGDHMIQRRIV